MVSMTFDSKTGHAEIEKPIEAVYVNVVDVIDCSVEEENGRTKHIGTLKNGGSYHVEYDSESGQNPSMHFNASLTFKDSDDSGEKVIVFVKKKA